MSCTKDSTAAEPPQRPLRIGPLPVDPPVLMAPMAGFTDYAFRQIVRRLGGVGLLAAEMISARGFHQMQRHQRGISDRLWGIRQEPRPLAVQIWDNDPHTMALVGHRLAHDFHVSVVDINFGCPVPEVSHKAHSGSYLLRYPDRVGEIVAWVVRACSPVPVTAKIRLGWTRDTINAIDVAQAVEEAGGAALTVHGRTAADKFCGTADWQQIGLIKPHLKRIPLIGNGDLRTPEMAAAAFHRYAVDGVMIGRAALRRPWLFRQIHCALRRQPIPPEPSLAQQRELLLEHYRYMVEQFGHRKGTMLMRRVACHYAHGHPGAKALRMAIGHVTTPQEFADVVDRCFPREDGETA